MKKFAILIPVYNDWKSVSKLLHGIDSVIANWSSEVSVLIINDASSEKYNKDDLKYTHLKSVKIINMKNNKGHARCNAAGLKFLTEKEDFDYVILMDGDGEDRPEELNLLYKKSEENPLKTVTANRIKRSEGTFFTLLYICHKILTYIFTGKFIKYGNFSCLPKEAAARLAKEACVWSSFSGSLTKIISNSERVSIPSIRGKRYFGPSQMNLFGLFVHSFSIIAVFKGSVIYRSVLFFILYSFFIHNNLSIITIFPLFAVVIFLFLILKTSSRENIKELDTSLENISSIDVLGKFSGR